MSQRDDTVPIRHMLDHAREARGLVANRSRAEIHADRMLQLALTRLVEIVGEAATRVSPETQKLRRRHDPSLMSQDLAPVTDAPIRDIQFDAGSCFHPMRGRNGLRDFVRLSDRPQRERPGRP